VISGDALLAFLAGVVISSPVDALAVRRDVGGPQ